MARRKKHQKLPNGFGSIKYLGKGRYKPYGVYPPIEKYTPAGPVTPKALAYVETWDEGYEILAARKMELEGKIYAGAKSWNQENRFHELYTGSL